MRLFFAALILVTFHLARAERPECVPSVQAAPSFAYCRDNTKLLRVDFSTLMSSPECPDSEYRELTTAQVELTGPDGQVLQNLILQPGEFTYSLGHGDGTLISPKHGFKYDNCITPPHGGLSFGN